MSVRELEFVKGERQRLRAELTSLESKRSKLSEASVALSEAEMALGAFEAAESAAVTAWSSSGCNGDRPVPAAKKHSELTAAVFLARRHLESSAPAIAVIDAAASDLRDSLHVNYRSLADAAAKQLIMASCAIGLPHAGMSLRRSNGRFPVATRSSRPPAKAFMVRAASGTSHSTRRQMQRGPD
jgi:hypothetical protein